MFYWLWWLVMDYSMYLKNRKSIRLKGYDYSQNGLYFVTIFIKNRENLLGEINNDQLILNDAGKMVEKWYFELKNKFKNIKCDNYVVMPNHFHFIAEIEKENKSISLSNIVQWLKTMTTNEYIRNIKNNNWKPFETKLWHRNYYEHIIKNENEYENIYNYITNNPLNWQNDDDKPEL